MNEKVKNIAKQAFGSSIDTDPVLVYKVEKFLELIVEECKTLNSDDHGEFVWVIKDHFGLEHNGFE